MSKLSEPSIYVIFGGTGDLSRRKLLPALARLAKSGHLNPRSHIMAVAIEPLDDDGFRKLAREALAAAGVPPEDVVLLGGDALHYHGIGKGGPADFQALAKRLKDLEHTHDLPGNRAFYLALPPQVFVSTIDGLGEAGLNKSEGWTRVIVEKPFGHDLASAVELNRQIHRWYDEKQIYRIDHYLGKETVQNLMVLRFANTIFESVWNRDRVEAVQITVAEDLGVGTRAGYYDRSGALRDMIQNHLTQLFTLVAMEIPSAYEAEAIRYEKIKVLRSTRPVDPEAVVRGRYTAGTIDGKPVPGYLDEPGIAATSKTETFVGVPLYVDNWRWSGVPFYLRTGKRMGKRLSQIAVRLRPTPAALFDSLGQQNETADALLIRLQPDAGFSLHFDVKVPGSPFQTSRVPLGFRYSERFPAIPEAYETLLLDVLEGDQTLFVHADEVEQSWRLYAPLLETSTPLHGYPAGTWGPPEADHLAIPDTDLWQESWSNGK
ncbi:MAG: glucose-6-phosphate dehydrogenase [Kofleriaceae bacterium]|nr:glucose-6-phosphate dehydrogenase [Kofleriaceae bacterium]MCB9570509.1 glucose-6-phosphate dehydrogenase [Kofleriaceae bacterium]